ncbi:hypothetical protein ABZX92_27700 [Lentzea sp. NPDC006480]|uniref:hypothetical protein n=1 Tax=Lentzea sp. NPDC006480 TaxID=3157176 RepID=UPI0033BCD69A
MALDHDDTAAPASVVALVGNLDAVPPPIYRELADIFGIPTSITGRLTSVAADDAQSDVPDDPAAPDPRPVQGVGAQQLSRRCSSS